MTATKGVLPPFQNDPLAVFPASHRGGVAWWDAPLPPRKHWCEAWSLMSDGSQVVERCACGAIRAGTWTSWLEVNSRRTVADDSADLNAAATGLGSAVLDAARIPRLLRWLTGGVR